MFIKSQKNKFRKPNKMGGRAYYGDKTPYLMLLWYGDMRNGLFYGFRFRIIELLLWDVDISYPDPALCGTSISLYVIKIWNFIHFAATTAYFALQTAVETNLKKNLENNNLSIMDDETEHHDEYEYRTSTHQWRNLTNVFNWVTL